MASQQETSAVVIGLNELQALRQRVLDAANRPDLDKLFDAVGQQQEDAARRRIAETKRDPSGKPWKPWSEKYAKSRNATYTPAPKKQAVGKTKREGKRWSPSKSQSGSGGQHSLMRDTGSLLDSLTHQVTGDGVHVGSNMVYAAAHLWGVEGGLPQRAYLDPEGGFADPHDRAELRDILRDWFEGLL